MGASSLHPPIHGTRIQVLDQIKKQNSKIVILKEVNILNYLDYPIMEVSAPVAEVFFILTADPSPYVGCGGRQYFLFLESTQLQRKDS